MRKTAMNRNKSTPPSGVDKVVYEIHQLLKHKNPVLVALDGRSGTGKSTIAQAIASRVEGRIVLSDGFYGSPSI